MMEDTDLVQASPLTIQNAQAIIDRTNYSKKLVRKLMDSSIIENESLLKSVVGSRQGLGNGTYYENTLNNSSILNNTTMYLDNTRHLIDPETPTSYQRNIYNSINCMPENETGTFATRNLYYDFNQCMTQSSSIENTLQLLNDYEECCLNQEQFLLKIKYKTGSDDQFESIDDMCGLLKNEVRTWRLLSCLYQDKIQEDIINTSMQSHADFAVINENEQKLIDVLFQENSDIRRAQNVVDWLEKNAAQEIKQNESKLKFFHDSTLWENTLYFLKQNQMKGTTDSTQSIVTEIDPDAPGRQKKSLYNLDKNDEIHLYKHMFVFIRAGKIEQAQEICVACGQPWRAASLEGWRLYNDPNITCNEMKEGDNVLGNPMRSLWKNTAWYMSIDESLNSHERAIYGIFCGNLKAILNACLSWEDFMWAYFKVLVDISVEEEVRNTSILRKRTLPQADSKQSQLPNAFWDQFSSVNSANKIFENLQSSSNEVIQQECNELFHLIQKYIILDDINAIIDTAHAWLQSHADEEELGNAQPQVLRFLIHLILFLNKFGLNMDEGKCNHLIEAYVKHLSSHEMTQSLVACYTAHLAPNRQIIVYSEFLKSVEGKRAQEEFLELARDAGLNVPKITKRVVDEIKETTTADYNLTFNDQASVDTTLNDVKLSTMDTEILPEDQRLIKSIDWLIYDPTQRADAIKQCCGLMRSFLISSKFMATKKVFEQIPDNSIDVIYRVWNSKGNIDLPQHVKNAIREYLCLKAYLSAHSSFKEWFVHFYNKKPIDKKVDSEMVNEEKTFSKKLMAKQRELTYDEQLESWQITLNEIANKVQNHIYNVLMFPDGGWLVDTEHDEDEKRSYELSVLRKMCIPTLCDLLVTVYENTGGKVDECLCLCSDITNSDGQLYTLFDKNIGRKLLKRIKDIALNDFR